MRTGRDAYYREVELALSLFFKIILIAILVEECLQELLILLPEKMKLHVRVHLTLIQLSASLFPRMCLMFAY